VNAIDLLLIAAAFTQPLCLLRDRPTDRPTIRVVPRWASLPCVSVSRASRLLFVCVCVSVV